MWNSERYSQSNISIVTPHFKIEWFHPIRCLGGDLWKQMCLTLTVPVKGWRGKLHKLLDMLRALCNLCPSTTSVHLEVYQYLCPYVLHWLTGIDFLTRFAMVTTTKPLQCILTRLWSAGQIEQRLNEAVRRQTMRYSCILVGCTSPAIPNRIRILLWGLNVLDSKHWETKNNLNFEMKSE